MIINFRIHIISEDENKLAQTSILIYIKKKGQNLNLQMHRGGLDVRHVSVSFCFKN